MARLLILIVSNYYLGDAYSVECQANLKLQVDTKHPNRDMELRSEIQNENIGWEAKDVVEATDVDGEREW